MINKVRETTTTRERRMNLIKWQDNLGEAYKSKKANAVGKHWRG
jgi:hypothetical protein